MPTKSAKSVSGSSGNKKRLFYTQLFSSLDTVKPRAVFATQQVAE